MAVNDSECSSCGGHYARQLAPEEVEALKRDVVTVGDFRKSKLEKEAKKNWDLFYKRNADHFFKDRHWLTREFPELINGSMNSSTGVESRPLVLLEAGCGVGNTVFPLLEENSNLYVYACDFSPVAVDIMKVCDIHVAVQLVFQLIFREVSCSIHWFCECSGMTPTS